MSGRNSNPHRPMKSSRDPTIRHSGRAHIRGQFRRVWRPRYLELCDSGLVRYYELPPTADVTLPEDSDFDHVNMIPKDTLLIYHARIIDVTTLRDLHVGLPGGSFGFLFRGQRSLTTELMVNPEPNPPREYFCAVSTLDEAQTWVVALQWAATMTQKLRRSWSIGYGIGGGVPSSCATDNNNIMPPSPLQVHFSHSTRRTTSSSNRSQHSSISETTSNDHQQTNDEDNDDTSIAEPKSTSKSGRTVVTKVFGYRIIKSPDHPLRWEVAYEIALLLLQLPRVEEQRVLKTRNDLNAFVQTLQRELEGDVNASSVVTFLRSSLLELPQFQKGCDAQEIIDSFSKVGKVLRTWAMNATIVNTQAFKRFFALDYDSRRVEDTILVQPAWWQSPFSPSSSTKPTMTYRKIRSIRSHVDTDEFVKQWLSYKSDQSQVGQSKALWVLQRPWLVVGGAGIGLAVLYPVFQVYQQIMISVTIRLDVLLLSWVAAILVGKQQNRPQDEGKRQQSKRRQRPETPPKPIHAAAAATPTISNSTEGSTEDSDGEVLDYISEEGDMILGENADKLSSPLPQYPSNGGESCWSVPPDNTIFRVRGSTYLDDKVKIPSGPSPFKCRGVDLWLTDNPQRHIARHPSVLGGKLGDEDTFLVNFLLPFGNFVAYFSVPPLSAFPDTLASVWSKFIKGDQQYRDARLKLLPVVMDGPWIVKAAVGNGTAPALLGKVIPLQYYFQEPDDDRKGIYEVDVIITASSIAKGILSVVKGHTKALSIAFAFIIEAAEQEELPETVLCSFQIHALHLEHCPQLPECNLD
eukprot:scaffold4452_cov155-Cylindrotheca_fusiformis.AAC.6